MIQLQYNDTGSSTVAIWSDLQPPFTGSEMTLQLTSSFEGNYSTQNVVISSNKSNTYDGGWILFNVSSSLVPTSSGHYTANIFEGIDSIKTWLSATEIWDTITEEWGSFGVIAYTWLEAPDNWIDVTDTWYTYGLTTIPGNQITTERVFVSGSDYDEQYKYTNEEISYYSVYNG